MKSIVVTGASSGIGKAIAIDLAKKNCRLFLLARREPLLKELCNSLSVSATPISCDLSEPSSIAEAVQRITDSTDAIHGLVNNAGIFVPGAVGQDCDSTWESQFATNLMGPVRLTRLLWPLLQKVSGSSIVNISSTLGIRPIPNTGAYSALKSALNSWTLTLALEGAPHNIRANGVCPGIVDTPIHEFHNSEDPKLIEHRKNIQTAQPLGRIGTPQDIAPLVTHLMSDESPWTTGNLIPVDGGILLQS